MLYLFTQMAQRSQQTLEKEVVALDSDRKSIEYAGKNFSDKKITYVNTRLENFKQRGKFDVVMALEIIEHLKKAGEEWANGRDQEDDVTFVVIKMIND